MQNLVFAQLSARESGRQGFRGEHFRKRRLALTSRALDITVHVRHFVNRRNIVKVDGVVITRPPPVDHVVSRIAADREVYSKSVDCAWHVGQVFVAVSADEPRVEIRLIVDAFVFPSTKRAIPVLEERPTFLVARHPLGRLQLVVKKIRIRRWHPAAEEATLALITPTIVEIDGAVFGCVWVGHIHKGFSRASLRSCCSFYRPSRDTLYICSNARLALSGPFPSSREASS